MILENKCNCGSNWNSDGVCMEDEVMEIAEQREVNGKTLKEWALTNPPKLESMFENEFDGTLRAQMIRVYKKYCMELKEKY